MALATDSDVILPKPIPLCHADYFRMDEGDPLGSGGAIDSDELEIVPPDSQVLEPNA